MMLRAVGRSVRASDVAAALTRASSSGWSAAATARSCSTRARVRRAGGRISAPRRIAGRGRAGAELSDGLSAWGRDGSTGKHSSEI